MASETLIEKGIYKLPDGRYVARLKYDRKDYERTFVTLEPARSWRRKLRIDLEGCPPGVKYTRRGWLAVAQANGRKEERLFETMEEAASWQVVTKRALINESFVDEATAEMTVEDFVTEWRKTKVKATDRTMMRYEVSLRNQILPFIGSKKLIALTAAEVQDWVARLKKTGHGAPSIEKAHALLGQVYELALDRELVLKNPTKKTELPTVKKKRQRSLTVSEVVALADECHEYKDLVWFLALTGCRISEALILKVQDVDFAAGTVNIDKAWTLDSKYRLIEGTTKTNQVRSIPMSNILRDVLENAIGERTSDEYLFKGKLGGALNYGYFRKKYYKPAVEKLGLVNTTIHTCRHSFASILVDNNATVANVSALLGHASSQLTLKTYTHTFNEGLKRDTAKFDEIFTLDAGYKRGNKTKDAA